jgi:RNA polymerase II subunit A small phosphatase-like protein
MSKGTEEKPQVDQEKLSPEDGSSSKKGRGLLHVPSRSSSQKIQPSPTSTGLSGATASDPRDSIGGHSKESKGSMLGRRRNGSASSNHSGAATAPTTSPTTSQPNSPSGASQRRKKGGGLLSLLGCCGVPGNANALDGGEDSLPSHKLEKIPQRRLTSSRRTITPSEQTQTNGSKTELQEKDKDSQGQASSSQDPSKATKRASGSTAQDQPIVGDRGNESKQTTLAGAAGPSITVNPPLAEHHGENTTAAESLPTKDADGDVDMADSEPVAASRVEQPEEESKYQKPVPPPPPGPIPNSSLPPATEDDQMADVASEHAPEQKWLLPPIEPRFHGKKCLVLDLDETLVHSSFKVSVSIVRGLLSEKLTVFRSSTKPISRYL